MFPLFPLALTLRCRKAVAEIYFAAWTWICWLCCEFPGLVRISWGKAGLAQAYATKGNLLSSVCLCQADGSVRRWGWNKSGVLCNLMIHISEKGREKDGEMFVTWKRWREKLAWWPEFTRVVQQMAFYLGPFSLPGQTNWCFHFFG